MWKCAVRSSAQQFSRGENANDMNDFWDWKTVNGILYNMGNVEYELGALF